MTSPLFSVIIPTFNRQATIKETLESVLSQEFRDFELIVVDDGSTDETAEIARSFPLVQLIQQPNAGPGAARNRGASVAKGKYLAFLDSDDLWLPWTLRTLHQVIKTQNDPAIIAGSILEFSSRSELQHIQDDALKLASYKDFLSAAEAGYFVGSGALCVARTVFNKSKGFVTSLSNCEDHDLMLRLGMDGPVAMLASPITLCWRRHAGSTTRVLSRTVEGVRYLVERELAEMYPGGKERSRNRKVFISDRTRPVIIEAIRTGQLLAAWQLFTQTIRWHLELRYARFFLAVIVFTILSPIQQLTSDEKNHH